MSLSLGSKQQSPSSLNEELSADSLSVNAAPGRWSSRVFYGLSAVLHLAAVVALSSTWLWHSLANKAQAETVAEVPARAPMARMAIDVGPIKFCEMNIETLVGRPQSQPGR